MKKKYIITIFFCVSLFLGSTVFPLAGSLSLNKEKYIGLPKEGKIIDLEPMEDLPTHFSWRNFNGTDFSTPVKNQYRLPSCESFAMISALEAMVQIEVGFPFDCDLSEAHLFFWSGGIVEWGSYPENDSKFLQEYGVPDEACWPYPKDKYQYPLNTTCPDWQNRTVKISDWYYLPEDRDVIKTALIENGPIPTYFLIYDDFLEHKSGIYQHTHGEVYGPHYVCIMGYNDDPGYWIIKNSWGAKFQEDGWFNIKYGECAIEKKAFYITGVKGKFPIAYVDDDNTEGPWNGSKEYPYKTIQEAIDSVYPFYTIYVMNGTYNENIIVDKKVRIQGENKETTIIDGGGIGDVVTISTPGIYFSGFTVQNSSKELFYAGVKTLNLKSNLTIKDNIIKDCDIGLFLNYAWHTAWNIVEDNIIFGNREGIYAHWSYSNIISGNKIIYNSEDGIEMQKCIFSEISANEFCDNGEYGIHLRGSSNANIISGKNMFRNNSIGIVIEESYKNQISKNNFINNSVHAYMYNTFLTKWKKNYWDDVPMFLPKIIKGKIGHIGFPYINIDWIPSRNQYK